jgi:acetyl-CoA carboxylase carboxyltransferase component
MTMTADSPASAGVSLPRDPLARLAALFDTGTMEPLTFASAEGSGAVAATGLIDGSGAVAFASDPRVQGGAMDAEGCAVIVAAHDEAIARGVPIVGLWYSGGARLAEGVASLHGVGTVFAAMTATSGVVPQISVVLGPAAGGAAYGPALTDVVILSDAPWRLPGLGVGQEWDGVVRHGAKLLHAFAEAAVPRVTLVTRKAIGGAYIAMNSRSLGATRVFAWPGAEVAVMGSVAAEHEATVAGLGRAIEIGVIDQIIEPAATAQAIASAIAAAPQRRGSHANIPL